LAINNTAHSIGPLFAHTIELKRKSPIVHTYPTHEVDEPYRWANSLILRLPGTRRGLVLGWWNKTDRTEEQALIDAMEGRKMSHTEFTEAEKVHIRRTMIRQQIPMDQQELLVDVLDL
jgi:hypothetical protein